MSKSDQQLRVEVVDQHKQTRGILQSGTDGELPEGVVNSFEKYRNLGEIAGGGNGVLFACDDTILGRTVALKMLHPDQQNFLRERRRLLREARITAQLQHPNTVPVYELGRTSDGRIYFSMKKIEGANLFKILVGIARGEEMIRQEYSLDRLMGVLVQASNALAYAHTRGVIHRDVKPENIFVGRYGEAYLMDWGVAKLWGMSEDHEPELPIAELFERLTVTGKRPGTPLYMSPEQIATNGHVDERSDIFSMGVVLYEVLAQREPFRGRNVEETFKNIRSYDPPPPSAVAQHLTVPPQLDNVCLKAMAKKPGDRYQTMMEMVKDIREFREQAMFG